MKTLPLDKRGYPVPWFVDYVNGEPEFRAFDQYKWMRAVREKLCWVCGQKLGAHLSFVIGPMCGITRTTSEPPCHYDCAEWSVRNCPFLSRPHMVRREDEVTDAMKGNAAGIPLERNPGVMLIWTAREYSVFDDGAGRPLISIGDPESIEWWAERKRATRAQIWASVESGLPFLQKLAEADGKSAVIALEHKVAEFSSLLPPD
jgi:hypothetical protein